MALSTSLLTAGSNSHAETSENANALATDIMNAGIVGTTSSTSGVAPTTGGFSVNAQGSPNMTVAVGTGVAYVIATPSSQGSQKLRVKNSASANVTISANASGSTKYDWLYIKIDAALAANPDVNATTVATLVTSRSSSSTSDDGTPPTYGTLLAVITVSNGASSIVNGNIADKRAGAIAGINSASSFFALNNFIESGCVWSGDAYASTKAASMTAGYVWINGVRLSVAAVTARTFTASKDTYVDLKDNLDGTASINYTEVTNNAASPALFGSGTTADTVRNAIIVTGATTIAAATSVNQGQETMVLPITSSIAYSVTDSLGNLICPRDPNRKLLGYSRLVSPAFTTTTVSSPIDVTGLQTSFIPPPGRKVKVRFAPTLSTTGAAATLMTAYVREGSTVIAEDTIHEPTSQYDAKLSAEQILTPTAGSHTYKASVDKNASGTMTVQSGTGAAASYMAVELFVELF